MKKTIIILLSIVVTISCQNKSKTHDEKSPNQIIEKHNKSLKGLRLIVNLEDKDLILKINKEVFSENFNPNILLKDIEKSKKYYEELSLGYFSIVKKTIYSLDSISIKDSYDQNKMIKIEKIKRDLGVFESQISVYRIESNFVISKYKDIIDIRQKCNNEVIKNQLAFSDDLCLTKFNTIVNSLNEHLKKMDDVKNNIEQFNLN